MEGVFKSPSPNPATFGARDFSFKRNSIGNTYQDSLFYTAQPLNKMELPALKNSDPTYVEKPPQFYFNISENKSQPFFENSQPSLNIQQPSRYNFYTAVDKLKLLSPKDEEHGSMQIPDEKKEAMNLTSYCPTEEWRPSVHHGNSTQRSRTPVDVNPRGSMTARIVNVRSHTPNGFKQKSDPEALEISRNDSPSRQQSYYGSTERYFETNISKIFKKDETNKSMVSRGSYVSNGVSPGKANRSRILDSPLRSAASTPMKKSAKMNSLTKIRLEGTPNAKEKTKAGFGAVKGTLVEVLDEKDQLKAYIEDLKQEMRNEKARLEEATESIRFLSNHMNCLAKRSGTLGKNTVNVQTLVNREREDVQQLQEEVAFLLHKLQHTDERIKAEKELIKANEQYTKNLKAQLSEETKNRDATKTQLEISRHDRKKSLEKYQNAAKTQKNIIVTLETQFQRYAS